MKLTSIGQSGLTGWRRAVGERGARLVSDRTRLTAEQAAALIGLAFFALSLKYVVTTVREAVRTVR